MVDENFGYRKERPMLSGHLQIKGGKYYAVLNCKHHNNSRFPKWIKTGIPTKKGAEALAKAKLDKLRKEYNVYGELIVNTDVAVNKPEVSEVPEEKEILFSSYMLLWLSFIQIEVEPNTYAGYYNSVANVISPYFKKKTLNCVI